MVKPLVVIVNGDRKHLFGMVLADHIVIEDLADFVLALAAERAIERVLGIAAVGLAHLKTPTRCESSQSLPRRPNQGHIAAAKLFGIKEVPTVRPRISARPTQAGWRLYTL